MLLTKCMCRIFFLIALPVHAMNVDNAQVPGHVAPQGTQQAPATQAQPQGVNMVYNGVRIVVDQAVPGHAPVPNLGSYLARSISEYVARPFSITTKLVSGGLTLAAYALLKKYCMPDQGSKFSRMVNIALNGLSVLSGLHVLRAAGKTKSELVPGVLGLFIGASPVMISDTLALRSGNGQPGPIYMQAAEGMRALGVVYAAGQCVSWFKNKIIRRCNEYLRRN